MFFMSDILKDRPNNSKSYGAPQPEHRSKSTNRMKCTQFIDTIGVSTPLDILDIKPSTSDEEHVTNKERLLIRKHPLYPILKLLAIKCEKATVQSNFNDYDTSDVMKLLRNLKANSQDIATENECVDSLMIAAILELRTQLKQLEKLNLDADICRSQLNENVKRTQSKLAKIMQNEFQDDDRPIFDSPVVKTRLKSFRIDDLLS